MTLSYICCIVQVQLATSLVVLGAWCGSLCGSFPLEQYGRRFTILFNNILYISGALFSASGNVSLLLIGRLLSGFGVGISSAVVPLLLSEISPATIRGTITSLHPVNLTAGIFVAGIVSYPFVMYCAHGWQYVQALTAAPAVIMIGMYSYYYYVYYINKHYM